MRSRLSVLSISIARLANLISCLQSYLQFVSQNWMNWGSDRKRQNFPGLKKQVLVIFVIFPTKTHPMLVASGQEYSHVSEALYCAARGAFLTSTATESCHTMYGLVNVEVDMGVPQQPDVFFKGTSY